MKRIILSLIIACGVIAPAVAMDAKKGAAKPKESLLNKYFDRKKLAKALAPLLINYITGDELDTDDTLIGLNGMLKALHIDILPITLKSKRKTTIGEFFDGVKLKALLKKVLGNIVESKFERKRFPKYLKLLRESLKMEAIKKEVGTTEWVELDKGFDTLIAYYNGDATGNVEDCVDLNKLPPFFGLLVQDSLLVPKLNTLLNSVLQGTPMTMDNFLECVDFDLIQLRNGYDPSELLSSEGIREACYTYFNFMHDDRGALQTFFDALGLVRHARKEKEGTLLIPTDKD